MLSSKRRKMTEQEKIQFLVGKIKELDRITSDIEHIFPEKSFKLDGILTGNIVDFWTKRAEQLWKYIMDRDTWFGNIGVLFQV